ncbi:hypothetical protein B5M09_010313 [Aphanomyces astaci]|uniref:formate--tetrahydrofolate ligase n=1 Tax=Aphanomyces astaci TaxID=112090 RepID=A0A3R7YBB9_APHAT|nr:hypothetical protein B5M09_010313 [Aphanomyces astaci]
MNIRNRVLDTCDRFLRGITIGQAPTEQGHGRNTGFDITVASEIMAVLALATSLTDMRERLGRMLDAVYVDENVELVTTGCANMMQHIRNALKFGVSVVVSVNRFASDSDREIEIVQAKALEAGASAAIECNHWYCSIEQKVESVCKQIYGADAVAYSPLALEKIQLFTACGYDLLPICMAKTHLSFSTDPTKKNVPTGYIYLYTRFTVTIRDIRASVGAGFLYLLCGDIMTVPGLPTRPGFYDVDVDCVTGKIVGLF